MFGCRVAQGVDFKNAFIYAIVLSIALILLFALFAGDGILGELPTMVIPFFSVHLVFTVSIEWIFSLSLVSAKGTWRAIASPTYPRPPHLH